MNKYTLKARKFLLFGLMFPVLGLVALIPDQAEAQVRSAYVKNVDEPGRIPYHEWIEFSRFSCGLNCANYTIFGSVILFDAVTPVPPGKRLIIEYMTAELPSTSSISSVSLQSERILSNQRVLWQYHGPFYATQTSGETRGMNSPAYARYEAGTVPHVRVKLGTATNFTGNVTISGYLIDADN